MAWLPHRAVSNSLGAGREPVLLPAPRWMARNGRFPRRRGIGSRLASTESETAVKLCMDLGFSCDYCSDLRFISLCYARVLLYLIFKQDARGLPKFTFAASALTHHCLCGQEWRFLCPNLMHLYKLETAK